MDLVGIVDFYDASFVRRVETLVLNWVSNCWPHVPRRPATAAHHFIRHLHRAAHHVAHSKAIVAAACTVGILGAVVGSSLFAPPATQGLPVTQAFPQPNDGGMGGTGAGSFPVFAIGQGFFNHGRGAVSSEPPGEDGLMANQMFDPADDLMKLDATPGVLDVDLYTATKTDVPTDPAVAQPVPEPSSLLIPFTSLLVLPLMTRRRRISA